MPGKLVRNRIPEIIEKTGETPVTHIASDAEYWDRLQAKLAEETDEFVRRPSEEELGDVLDVIDAIINFRKYDQKKLKKSREKKIKERGAFDGRIILDKIE